MPPHYVATLAYISANTEGPRVDLDNILSILSRGATIPYLYAPVEAPQPLSVVIGVKDALKWPL